MKPLLHPQTQVQFNSLAASPHGSYVFYGPTGIGKATAAKWLAQSWHGHDQVEPSCVRCTQISAMTYPDLVVLEAEGDSLGIAAIAELRQRLTLSRYDTIGQRVVVIDCLPRVTLEAQNALLKLVEEPPSETVVIFLASSPRDLIETLRSRVQPIEFIPLPDETIASYLSSAMIVPPERAAQISGLAAGLAGFALRLVTDQVFFDTYLQIAATADQLLSAELFERLVLAAELGDSKTVNIDQLMAYLQQSLRARLRQAAQSGDSTSMIKLGSSLAAIERCFLRLRSNTGLKSALSGLVVELA